MRPIHPLSRLLCLLPAALLYLALAGLLLSLSACGGGGSSSSPDATVLAQGIVVDDQGVPLADAQVQVVSSSRVRGTDTQTTTGGDGRFMLTLDATTPAVLRFSKTGHASSVRAMAAASQNEAVAPRVILLPVAATQSFDATEAQVLRVPGSTARVALSAASLVRDDGQPISGAVTVALTPVDPSADPLRMPGLMVDADSGTPIESLGALGIEFTDASGAPLNLASGQTAVIRIPATPAPGATLPATYPLYHLNETTGLWDREGTATLHTDPMSGDSYYEATVGHFSWWNADQEITRSTVNVGATSLGGICTIAPGLRVVALGLDYNGTTWANGTTVAARANSQVQVRLVDAIGVVLDTLELSTGAAGSTLALPRCLSEPATVRISGLVTVNSGSLQNVRVQISGAQMQTQTVAPNDDGSYAVTTYAGRGSITARLVSIVDRGTPATSVSGVVGNVDTVLPDLTLSDTRFALNGCVDGWATYRQSTAQVALFKGDVPIGTPQTVSAASPNFSFGQAPLNSTLTLTLTPADDTLAERSTTLVVGNTGVNPGSCLSLPQGPMAQVSTTGTGLSRSFDASASSAPEGTITSAAWRFGDGATATGLTTSHTYASAGSYTVTLTLTDDLGQQSNTTVAVVATSGGAVPTLARRQIDSGQLHTCWLDGSGGVRCEGYDGYGQLGGGELYSNPQPVQVQGLSGPAVEVAAGGDFSCALSDAGAVQCWGNNGDGTLGNGGSPSYSASPVPVSGLSSGVVAIAAGHSHACALTNAGGVVCWGRNDFGTLGNGSNTHSNTPVAVSGLNSGVVAISAGGSGTCAVTQGAGVLCWGFGYGAGGGSTNVPVAVSGLTDELVSISLGQDHGCAVTSQGAVLCWGQNTHGQLGDGSNTASATPVAVVGAGSGFVAVSAQADFTCALTSAGQTHCWGRNAQGQLGNGSTSDSNVPVLATEQSGTALDVGVRDFAGCVLRDDRSLQCWGWLDTYVPGG